MTIRARLTLAFAILGILLLLQVGVSYYSDVRSAASLARVVDAHEVSNTMTVLALAGQKMRRFEKEYFIYLNDLEKRDKYSKSFFASHDRLKNEFVRMSTRQTASWGSEDLQRLASWDEALNAYARGFTRVDLEVGNGAITDTLAANAAIQEAKNQFRVFLSGSAELIGLKHDQTQAIAGHARAEQGRIRIAQYLLAIIGLLAALAMIGYVPVAISRPLTQLTRAANEMSKGKIRDDIPVTGPPEIRDLAASMERMRVALRGIVERLQARRPSAAVTPLGAGTTTSSGGTRPA